MVEGDLDLRGFLGISAHVRKGHQKVRVKMHVQSQGPACVLRELAQYSPVFDIVSGSLPVKVDVERLGEHRLEKVRAEATWRMAAAHPAVSVACAAAHRRPTVRKPLKIASRE
jgi:hypothetical protein